MKNDPVYLTVLERKVFDEIVRPAISQEKTDHIMGTLSISQTLNFSHLLKEIKSFYERNGGQYWEQIKNETNQ